MLWRIVMYEAFGEVYMKRFINSVLGVWCAITCFVSPIWLTMIFLNLTGLIYQYDYSMDEGTAFIIGVILLILWLVFALFPNIVFIRNMYINNRKKLWLWLVIMVLICILCVAMCGWNILEFLTVPGK